MNKAILKVSQMSLLYLEGLIFGVERYQNALKNGRMAPEGSTLSLWPFVSQCVQSNTICIPEQEKKYQESGLQTSNMIQMQNSVSYY